MLHKSHKCSDIRGEKYHITLDGVDCILCQACFDVECDRAISKLEAEGWKVGNPVHADYIED